MSVNVSKYYWLPRMNVVQSAINRGYVSQPEKVMIGRNKAAKDTKWKNRRCNGQRKVDGQRRVYIQPKYLSRDCAGTQEKARRVANL